MPRGRPKKIIDLEAVEELAAEGNTQADIADALDFARAKLSRIAKMLGQLMCAACHRCACV